MVRVNEIRVNSGITIKVNDNGDTITVNADNQCFVENFYGLYERLENLEKETKSDAVKNQGDRERLQFMIGKTKEIMADMDSLFGENACRKIFGDIVPNTFLLVDFFDQLSPVVEKYADERRRKIDAKYNKRRKGSRKRYRTKEEIIRDGMR